VGLINIDDLKPFIYQDVGVSIYDETWTDQSPLRSKRVHKVELCPKNSHLRIYFDEKSFFAIPRTSKIEITESNWTAVDEASGLHYVIKSGRDNFD
jgi:hypothetical protein